ncbi:hypothetical protein [Novosphingobium soli]|uniref:Bacterial surface antigen (D15) domain-containing protein n=1 Tax=Novosphingobium soli TaxID=574956 RepID=A0ABV6CU61_9SPHN
MSAPRLSRGHPVFALLALLGGWVAGRAASWEPPQAQESASMKPSQAAGPQSQPGFVDAYGPRIAPGGQPVPIYFAAGGPPILAGWRPATGAGGAAGWSLAGTGATGPEPGPAPFAAGHLAAEFAGLAPAPRFYAPEGPGAITAALLGGAAAPTRPFLALPPARARRWSMDAWALLRRESGAGRLSPGALPATYGASQAGAVLRYRLMPTDRHVPSLYLRSTSATGQVRETALALGLSARPLPSVPIVAALEGRVTDQSGTRRVQPAAMAITELPPFALPAGFRGEAYAQAGYVGGRFATPFADGQVRADRRLLQLGSIEARLGAGAWGGVQKGAARIDAGPSATVAMPLGRGMNGRVAVDWRFRVAGDAMPGSGPAVTLSAGF